MRSLRRCSAMKSIALILEDEYFLADELSFLISQRYDVETLIVSKQSEALSKLTPDIKMALLDINTEDGASFKVAEKLIELNIPFIFISGRDPKNVPENLQSKPFLKKPFLPSQLFKMLNGLETNK
jgi:two-component SAPR family response regulator